MGCQSKVGKDIQHQMDWHLQPKGLINLDQHNSNISVIEGVIKETNEATCWMMDPVVNILKDEWSQTKTSTAIVYHQL
ncbi:hypothetical protein ACFX13_017573 [Malus domestica]